MLLLFSLLETLSKPWPWYVSGILIATVMAFMLFSGKRFGISSTFRAACSILGAGKVAKFFVFDWKKDQGFNLVFAAGALLGGLAAAIFLANPEAIEIGERTSTHLSSMGFSLPEASKNVATGLAPKEFSELDFILSWKGFVILVLGGFLVGFGTRYAGGCTSGHAISGLSELQLPSLIAVIGFFIGGLLMTWLLMPLIF